MDRNESEALLEKLFDIAEDPAIIYEHIWRPGDLVMWDNLACLHARTDWPPEQRRDAAPLHRRGRAAVLRLSALLLVLRHRSRAPVTHGRAERNQFCRFGAHWSRWRSMPTRTV